ncbi:MAG: hypothetical protein M3R43_12495, partial [Acidobacteriota bacterium]|nr:hypothetical protein [Acidobacteriota bacterium]
PATGTDALRARVDYLMNTHIRDVEQLVPPGWSIAAKPVAAARGPNDTMLVQVHIFVKGAPEGTLFEQQTMPVGDDKAISAMQGISVGKDGILMCAVRSPEQCGDPKNPDDPIEFTASTIKGEPLRFLFISEAGKIGLVVVPNPVGGQNRGCTLSAVRLTPDFALALITGTGFPPNTDIHYISTPNSAGTQVVRSNDMGVIRFSLLPYAKSRQKSGSLKVRIAEPQCSPEISYDWGKL